MSGKGYQEEFIIKEIELVVDRGDSLANVASNLISVPIINIYRLKNTTQILRKNELTDAPTDMKRLQDFRTSGLQKQL